MIQIYLSIQNSSYEII